MAEFSNELLDGKRVQLYTLKTRSHPAYATITNYGARLVSLYIPNKDDRLVNVVMGFDTLQGYLNSSEQYFGATIGRFANRIADGKFSLDGQQYTLAQNNGPNCLHGGLKGFHSVVWDVEQPNEWTLVLTYLSPHMQEGFPGNLKVKVTYSLEEESAGCGLAINYEATTDQNTVLNLTNHAFFNLNGVESGTDVMKHCLEIYADTYLPANENQIPTGELSSVSGSPFDFTCSKAIGASINTENNQQLQFAKGYDHNYILNSITAPSIPCSLGVCHLAANAVGDLSGIQMTIYTQEPGIQLYSGNFLEGKNNLKGGVQDGHRTAFCLETQHFPDSPNQPNFPSTELKPEELFKSCTIHKFSLVN
uniref:Aldose 1-epimerase n=1 Tax=Ditylenchus dipsaci TaxID=166011 RepID=A0A915E1B8_9BILA